MKEMRNLPQDEEEKNDLGILAISAQNLTKKNKLEIEKDQIYNKKRSSSSSSKFPNNFVPKLKPIKANICPSPINLNKKSNPLPAEKQNLVFSTESLDSQNKFNLNPINYICTTKKIIKKSIKFLNIEEETHAISDHEDNSKQIIILTDSDTSQSEEDEKNKKIKKRNIKMMREQMKKIKNNFIINDNLNDDFKIENTFRGHILFPYDNIGRRTTNFHNISKKKRLIESPLKKIKYRPKSLNNKQRYVPTILGYLENSSSRNSLNSNEK